MSETMHAGVDQQRRRIIIHSTIAAGLTAAGVAAAQETKPVAPANEPKEVKNMTHKCRITVLRKTLHKDLQEAYLADPKSGVCPFFQEGQVFELTMDDFFRTMHGKFCAEAWDCISRYVYAALQGGSIMRGWTKKENVMIASCNDGTRPVIFKIERIDE